MAVIMMVMASDRLCQILNIGELAALGCAREIGRNTVELVRGCRITFGLCRLGGLLQIGRDLLRDLLILRWIRLLKLLERAH